MAYDYLGLVNDVNRKLNEVELTAGNFASATGFYSQAKDAVNSSINDINQLHYEWPFNYVEEEETLSVGVTRYSFPTNSKIVDMDSFRIKQSDTLNNSTQKLKVLAYEEYLDNFVDQEYNSDNSLQGVPQYVFRGPGLEFGLSPAPDQAYEIVYEYYRTQIDLVNATDVPNIPEIFRHVIIEGAMYHAYMFRSNEQSALIAKEKFTQNLKSMRSILVNRYHYVRSTAITHNKLSNYVYRLR